MPAGRLAQDRAASSRSVRLWCGPGTSRLCERRSPPARLRMVYPDHLDERGGALTRARDPEHGASGSVPVGAVAAYALVGGAHSAASPSSWCWNPRARWSGAGSISSRSVSRSARHRWSRTSCTTMLPGPWADFSPPGSTSWALPLSSPLLTLLAGTVQPPSILGLTSAGNRRRWRHGSLAWRFRSHGSRTAAAVAADLPLYSHRSGRRLARIKTAR